MSIIYIFLFLKKYLIFSIFFTKVSLKHGHLRANRRGVLNEKQKNKIKVLF
jgi:hypothetical protein